MAETTHPGEVEASGGWAALDATLDALERELPHGLAAAEASHTSLAELDAELATLAGLASISVPVPDPVRTRSDVAPPAVAEKAPSVSPKPSTLDPKPPSVHPRPSTLNPKPPSLNPKPPSLNPKVSSVTPSSVAITTRPPRLTPAPPSLSSRPPQSELRSPPPAIEVRSQPPVTPSPAVAAGGSVVDIPPNDPIADDLWNAMLAIPGVDEAVAVAPQAPAIEREPSVPLPAVLLDEPVPVSEPVQASPPVHEAVVEAPALAMQSDHTSNGHELPNDGLDIEFGDLGDLSTLDLVTARPLSMPPPAETVVFEDFGTESIEPMEPVEQRSVALEDLLDEAEAIELDPGELEDLTPTPPPPLPPTVRPILLTEDGFVRDKG